MLWRYWRAILMRFTTRTKWEGWLLIILKIVIAPLWLDLYRHKLNYKLSLFCLTRSSENSFWNRLLIFAVRSWKKSDPRESRERFLMESHCLNWLNLMLRSLIREPCQTSIVLTNWSWDISSTKSLIFFWILVNKKCKNLQNKWE